MNNNYEIKLLNLSEFGTILFLIATIISLYLIESEKKKKNNQNINNLQIYNRIFIILILLLFLFINIENKRIAEYNNKDIKPYNMQIMASILVLIAAVISLYQTNYSNQLANIENPEL